MDLPIRPARASDLEGVASFTTSTFSWGDYVAESFLDWLNEADTRVGVVTDHDRPVAVARVRMLGAREGWLSAARVHPDYRRRGLGSALNDWCVEWVRSQGGAVVRLQIETWNEAAHNQVAALGYRRVATVLNAERSINPDGELEPATNGGKRTRAEERLDQAPRAEADGAYIAWSTSELARAAHGLFPAEQWAWRRMSQEDARAGRTWFCPSGWVMADEDEGELLVSWMVCTPEDAPGLVRAAVDLAHDRQLEGIHLIGPSLGWVEEALLSNGLEVHPTHLYEKPL